MTKPWNNKPGIWSRLAGLCAMLLICSAVTAQATAPDAWWNALVRDDTTDVRTMLLRHVDPNSVEPKTGLPAIMFAIRKQSWKVYDILSTTPGIQIDAPNRLDETALMYLSLLGETQRAQALIAAGAQVNRLGWTPLHYAASKGRNETLQMLIEQRAIVNAPGPDGTTPLMMAALYGSESTVRLLLESGADATMFNLKHQTAADWATVGKHTKLAGKLNALAVKVQAQHDLGPRDATPSSTTPKVTEADKKSISNYFDPDLFEDVPVGQ